MDCQTARASVATRSDPRAFGARAEEAKMTREATLAELARSKGYALLNTDMAQRRWVISMKAPRGDIEFGPYDKLDDVERFLTAKNLREALGL
jgi:hypothetical protein